MLIRRAIIAVIVPLLLLLGACGPVAEKPTPTPAPTGVAPKPTLAPKPAATPKPAAEKPQRGGTLVYANTRDPAELDPHKITTGPSRYVTQLMFNTLVNLDKDANIVPELAESWSYTDPTTLVFKLRKGVKFHDGTDFNAEAVKFSIERVKDPATKPNLGRPYIANIRSVEVVDDYTVKFNLETPQASSLGILANIWYAGFISPASVKKWGDDTINHPVGTGPFQFVEWVKDDHITLKRFDGYWRKDEYGDPLPYLDQVIIKPILEPSVMLTNLRTGNVDVIANLLGEQVPLVEGDKNLKILQSGGTKEDLKLNTAKPPFDNKALRQAVAWAIDRESLLKALFASIGEVAHYTLPSKSWAFDPTGKFYTKDNAKAKQKLAEGGKPDGFKFVADWLNSPFELRVAQAIKAQLAEVGIDMEIVPMDRQTATAKKKARNFELTYQESSSFYADPDMAMYVFFHTKGAANDGGYSNPEVDKLLEQARVIYDQGERKALYAKAQALILDDSPVIVLHHSPGLVAMNQKVMGFTPSADAYHLLFDWYWLKR